MAGSRTLLTSAAIAGAIVVAFACVLPVALAETSGTSVAERLRAISEPGGSDAWDVGVKAILLEAFDADKSGTIDNAQEVRAIPCTVLNEMDQLIKPFDVGKSGLAWTYGFQPDTRDKKYDWVGDAFGFDKNMRSVAYKYMIGCGVRHR